ncbi:C45 family autoproteolytic acyltransferase/hydolase [Paracoccus siganidrum]|uniref:6-aminopenicillanic acid acyl-transferase n=1 Tax=Paracoccus siganidrum TaxID=1276757 RepID=A0A419A4L3_9RHOB|nr:C45 family peptidase [Paracoccus siganidrum]RJL09641.1 6-aminopenicillanic acid acyl-transferase [Paracoccus siganidrum]RMC35845.1 6-aminopenicillanic acid acyl-transferase [Paracoccus siganidrum]
MLNKRSDLGWIPIRGDARARGVALGRAGRDAVHRDLLSCDYWRRVTDPALAPRVAAMARLTGRHFPQVLAEIEGLAEGLGLPFAPVMAWNCRGDLLASVPDGCTTVMLPGRQPVIAHNEDGLPFFRGDCFIADVAAEDAPGFRAFCYPGSIPGHTLAFTDAGLVQAVNNIRLRGAAPGLPRMVLGRAVLGMASADQAVALLRAHPAAGGFHFTLCDQGERRLLSVEFGNGRVSVREIAAPALHANHALHLAAKGQIVTRSSADRQARGEALLAKGADPLTLLRDTGGDGLPIRRDAPDDPDHENTLATALFRVAENGIEWSIHDRSTGAPAYRGLTARDTV